MSDPKFNDPVFVRNDDTTTIKASVVEWNREGDDASPLSVLLSNGNESVLVNVADWATLVACVNVELNRCS